MAVGRNYVLDLPFHCNEAITKGLGVKLVTGTDQTIDQSDTLGEDIIGVAMETATTADATANRVIAVAVIGTVVAEAGSALTIGDYVRVAADGQFVALAAATADQEVAGQVLTAPGAAGEWFTLLLMPGVQHTTS